MATSAAVLADLVGKLADGSVEVVDLSVTLSPDTPVIRLPDIFAQSPGVSFETISEYDAAGGETWYWRTLRMGEHTGTHFDAPVHWASGRHHPGSATDTITPQRLVGPACVIDKSADAAADPDTLLTVADVEAWEARHGRIPGGAWVLMRTDWSKKTSAAEFLNAREDGPHTPGPSVEVMRFLIGERDIEGFGVETVGTDAGQAAGFDVPFPCHTLMHGANKFGLASLANLDRLPPTGAVIIAAPLKLKNGSGSPLRVIALVPRR
jgi:kynurenine formamidase